MVYISLKTGCIQVVIFMNNVQLMGESFLEYENKSILALLIGTETTMGTLIAECQRALYSIAGYVNIRVHLGLKFQNEVCTS